MPTLVEDIKSHTVTCNICKVQHTLGRKHKKSASLGFEVYEHNRRIHKKIRKI